MQMYVEWTCYLSVQFFEAAPINKIINKKLKKYIYIYVCVYNLYNLNIIYMSYVFLINQ